jgi:hypothetical protein
MKVLLQVFEQLPGLENISFMFTEKAVASSLISGLSLKKLFTRLRTFDVKLPDIRSVIPQHDTEKVCLLSSVLLPNS